MNCWQPGPGDSRPWYCPGDNGTTGMQNQWAMGSGRLSPRFQRKSWRIMQAAPERAVHDAPEQSQRWNEDLSWRCQECGQPAKESCRLHRQLAWERGHVECNQQNCSNDTTQSALWNPHLSTVSQGYRTWNYTTVYFPCCSLVLFWPNHFLSPIFPF